jgi:hypothetical protein
VGRYRTEEQAHYPYEQSAQTAGGNILNDDHEERTESVEESVKIEHKRANKA